jgi:hypothetical protein
MSYSRSPQVRTLAVVAALAALVSFAGGLFAADADAQRRRPRPRPRPAQPPPATDVDAGAPSTTSAVEANPFDAPMAASPDAGVPQAQPTTTGTGAPTVAPPPQAAVPGTTTGMASATGDQSAPEEAPPPDLSPLRDEFTSVMDDLVQTRARIATLGRSLFRTKIRVDVQDRSGDDQSLTRIAVLLDGAPVFRAQGAEFNGEDGKRVFEGFAAPGPHTITVEVEMRARDGDTYRYTLRDAYRFEVIRNKMTEVVVVLDGESEIAEDFADDGEGEYDVRTRFRVATRDLEAR